MNPADAEPTSSSATDSYQAEVRLMGIQRDRILSYLNEGRPRRDGFVTQTKKILTDTRLILDHKLPDLPGVHISLRETFRQLRWRQVYRLNKYVLGWGMRSLENRADNEELSARLDALSGQVRELLQRQEQRDFTIKRVAPSHPDLWPEIEAQLKEFERRLPPLAPGTSTLPSLDKD